jgi:hypothetical protein
MPLPPIHELCIKTPLYERLQVGEKDAQLLKNLISGSIQFDCFCVGCKGYSIFKRNQLLALTGKEQIAPSNNQLIRGKLSPVETVIRVELQCARFQIHTMNIFFSHSRPPGTLVKIGQYPSLADLATSELTRYKQILGDERVKELHRAQGLAAHGIGVGSFVYLRRIFESLLEERRQECAAAGSDIAGYAGLSIDRRIEALKELLPQLLVRNKSIYQILSKGIHELDENTCLYYYPVVRDGIVLILEEDFQQRARKKMEEQLHADIQKLTESLRSGDSPPDS